MLKYTEDHEWLKQDGDDVVVGITAHASEQLGDVVFIELPEVGREVEAGEEIVVIESVKAASDITAPVAGTIVAVNEALSDTPGAVNDDPLAAWRDGDEQVIDALAELELRRNGLRRPRVARLPDPPAIEGPTQPS